MPDDVSAHEQEPGARRKSAALPWLVGCSVGCLTLGIAGVALLYFGMHLVAIRVDPSPQGSIIGEDAWERLEEIVAVRERPPSATLMVQFTPERTEFLLERPELGLMGVFALEAPSVTVADDPLASALRRIGGAQVEPADVTEVDLQGRSVRSTRHEGPGTGRVLSFDLGRRGSRQLLFVVLRMEEDAAAPPGPPSVDEAERFLEHFDLWREK